ncbi:hypothetical protein J2S49_001018 [Arcanobacterium wilhelmae]|uniref:Uncharacterized protein n=1 Tax=Arcanobacterium wilhelmae TaxID=1803177 RepID=A0ABT9NB98_9ACTO|nr:hypothetical protein [Arcanobacterium wilhelmae]MDP9800942.1 hypothetical protein [Arcanobacterium wilhelmae]WFN90302.1 hypothetical protein P8A24_00125 [Arcanobacterium wilhelmae]
MSGADLVIEGERWGIPHAASLVEEMLDSLTMAITLPEAYPGLVDEIGGFIDRLRRE